MGQRASDGDGRAAEGLACSATAAAFYVDSEGGAALGDDAAEDSEADGEAAELALGVSEETRMSSRQACTSQHGRSGARLAATGGARPSEPKGCGKT